MNSIKTKSLALHITGLFTLSVAHPIYNLFSNADHTTFFIAHHAKAIDVWLLVFLFSLLIPLLLVAVLWMVSLLSKRLSFILYLGVFFVLLALILVPALDRLVTGPWPVIISVGLCLSALIIFFYLDKAFVRQFFSIISVGIVVSPLLFLTSAPMRTFMASPENQDVGDLWSGGEQPNIVMIVFDELPLSSLLETNDLINPELYPNFHELANSSTWFRNTAATHTATQMAMPAMLTGVLQNRTAKDRASVENIFTLMSASHRVVAMEHATRLSEAVNDDHVPHPPLSRRMSGELQDLALVYFHIVIPTGLKDKLPIIDNQWNNFSSDPNHPTKSDSSWPYQGHWPRQTRYFIDQLQAGSSLPTFYFFHLLMPHQPFQYDQMGNRHSVKFPKTPRRPTGKNPYPSSQLTTIVYQAHLLKLSFADRMLGHILQSLRDNSLFDSSLIVVTADHGISFYWDQEEDQEKLKKIQVQDLVTVPLFIKRPHQSSTELSDAPVQTHDIVPTITQLLDIQIPWKIDGISAFEVKPSRQRTAFLGENLRLDNDLFSRQPTLEWKLSLFGNEFEGLYNHGPRGDMVGQPISNFEIHEGYTSVSINNQDQFADIKLNTGELPGYADGIITLLETYPGNRDLTSLDLAIAINGRITTTTSAWKEGNEFRLLSRLPPESFKQGMNEIDVYRIDSDDPRNILFLTTNSER